MDLDGANSACLGPASQKIFLKKNNSDPNKNKNTVLDHHAENCCINDRLIDFFSCFVLTYQAYNNRGRIWIGMRMGPSPFKISSNMPKLVGFRNNASMVDFFDARKNSLL